MSGTLYTGAFGAILSADELEAFDAILHSVATPDAAVTLLVTDGSVLDLSEELGLVAARVWLGDDAGTALLLGGGSDTVYGGHGQDSIGGGAGDDRLAGYDGDDVLDGGDGDDRLLDSGGDDTLFGGAGDDLFDVTDAAWAGSGARDALHGGAGADSFVVTGGSVDGGSGRDVLTVRGGDLRTVTVAGVEVLATGGLTVSGTVAQLESFQAILVSDLAPSGAVSLIVTDAGRIDLAGELGARGASVAAFSSGSTIITGAGDDLIVGSDAADLLVGNAGRDEIRGGDGADTLNGGAGADEVEGGDGADAIVGGAGDDRLDGGAGHDAIDGGAGADAMRGGAGDDRYVVDDAGDLAIEATLGIDDGGQDRVTASVDHALAAFVEDLTLAGAAVRGTGNGLANGIVGSAGANDLAGQGGADMINAGAGDDTLAGGDGADILTGGAGADAFLFDAGPGTGIDRVKDYAPGIDRLVFDDAVFALAAGAGGEVLGAQVRFGTAAADADDLLIYDQASGRLWYDADGSGAGAKVQVAALNVGQAIALGDLFVA